MFADSHSTPLILHLIHNPHTSRGVWGCARLKNSHIERAGMPENIGLRPVQSLSDPFRDIAHAFFKELPHGTVTTLYPKLGMEWPDVGSSENLTLNFILWRFRKSCMTPGTLYLGNPGGFSIIRSRRIFSVSAEADVRTLTLKPKP